LGPEGRNYLFTKEGKGLLKEKVNRKGFKKLPFGKAQEGKRNYLGNHFGGAKNSLGYSLNFLGG